jgi:hypothetical protein
VTSGYSIPQSVRALINILVVGRILFLPHEASLNGANYEILEKISLFYLAQRENLPS